MAERVRQTRVTFGSSNDDLLTAVSEAIWHVNEAMDELRGHGEYEEWFNTLDDLYSEMEEEQDMRENYATGEYEQEMADLRRDYERDLLWDTQYGHQDVQFKPYPPL